MRTAFLHKDKLYPNHLVPGRQQLLNPLNSCRFCVAGWPGSLSLQKDKTWPVRLSLVTCCMEAKALHSICGNSQGPGATSPWEVSVWVHFFLVRYEFQAQVILISTCPPNIVTLIVFVLPLGWRILFTVLFSTFFKTAGGTGRRQTF